MKVPLEQQVAALREVVSHHRSYVTMVKRFVLDGNRPKEVLEETEARLPLMEAALRTMEWVESNQDLIREAYNSRRNGS